MLRINSLILLFLFAVNSSAQVQDSLNRKRLYFSLAADAVIVTGVYIGLNELWYKDYERTGLHWFNDCNEWQGMDKLGHSFASYHVSSIYSAQMLWSGLGKKKSAILGSGLGFVTISIIELLDAKSEQWGASAYDLAANFVGSAFYLSQQLAWQEERISFKYSFHQTEFAQYRPELLGENYAQQILKDYNGQTYWLSANIRSFVPISWWPKYLNIAFGYGATGMLGAKSNPSYLPFYDREQHYYLSLDIDLNRIPVKSKFLKSIFSVINIVKIPMPTLELRSGKLYGHYLYF